MPQTSDAPVPFSTFIAEVRRLDAADASSTLRLESHIRDYRREQAEMKSTMMGIDSKMDLLLENQNRWKGRDGVILVMIGMFTAVMTAIITASILGVIR